LLHGSVGFQRSDPISSAVSLAGLSSPAWPASPGFGRSRRAVGWIFFALEYPVRSVCRRRDCRHRQPLRALAQEEALRLSLILGCDYSDAFLHAGSVG